MIFAYERISRSLRQTRPWSSPFVECASEVKLSSAGVVENVGEGKGDCSLFEGVMGVGGVRIVIGQMRSGSVGGSCIRVACNERGI